MKQIAASYCLHSEPLCSLEMIIYVRQWIKFLWKCVRQMQNTIYLEGQLNIGIDTYRSLLCSWNDPRERIGICEMIQNQRFLISWEKQEKKPHGLLIHRATVGWRWSFCKIIWLVWATHGYGKTSWQDMARRGRDLPFGVSCRENDLTPIYAPLRWGFG